METLSSSTGTLASSPPLVFSPKPKDLSSSRRILRFCSSPNYNGNQSDFRPDSGHDSGGLVPMFTNRTLSKDAAMGLVLSAANVRGWTTGSGMEGPPVPADSDSKSAADRISTFPWSLFTKSPRRRMLVAFTCNVCGQRTTRAINPHAYSDGTVFVQCCGCNVFHKLVDNLNLFHGMKCYVDPSFNLNANSGFGFRFMDYNDDDDDVDGNDDFPLL